MGASRISREDVEDTFRVPCGDTTHRIVIGKNGNLTAKDHPGVPQTVLLVEEAIVDGPHCGNCLPRGWHVDSSPPRQNDPARQVRELAYYRRQLRREHRRKHGRLIGSAAVREMLTSLRLSAVQRACDRTDLAGHSVVTRFCDNRLGASSWRYTKEISINPLYWAGLFLQNKTTLVIPKGHNGGLSRTLVLGEDRGNIAAEYLPNSVLNVVTDDGPSRRALARQVGDEWHWVSWF